MQYLLCKNRMMRVVVIQSAAEWYLSLSSSMVLPRT